MQRILIVSAVTASSWALASWWCIGLSERVYFTIPPLALAIFLTGIPDLRQTLWARIRPGLAMAAGMLVVGLGITYLLFGPEAVLSSRIWMTVATEIYFLTSAVILLLGFRRGLLAGARRLHEALGLFPTVRVIVCEVLPLAVFVFFALPYAMAFAHVHRFKAPNLTDPKRTLDRDFEDVEFASSDGTRLRGWWLPAKTTSSRTLVLCHGVAGNRAAMLPFVEVGDWLDANVFMFDLRGHGDSDGRTVTLGCREKCDVLAAIAYVRQERPGQTRQVIGMGLSLGAASMVEAAADVEPPLDAVILDSCFTSTFDMTDSVLRTYPRFVHPWLMLVGLPMADLHAGCAMTKVCPEGSINRLRAPVVLLHSRGDPVIPSSHAIRLHQHAREPKHLCIFELNGHCDAFFAQRDRYHEAIRAITTDLEDNPR